MRSHTHARGTQVCTAVNGRLHDQIEWAIPSEFASGEPGEVARIRQVCISPRQRVLNPELLVLFTVEPRKAPRQARGPKTLHPKRDPLTFMAIP